MGKMIVSFTHSNYKIKPTGTEKFVRNLSGILQKNNYDHLNFFSFYTDAKVVGVNYNDKFEGVYSYEQIESIIEYYAIKHGNQILTIHFQHILNHRLDVLKNLVIKLKVPVCIVLHDYFLVCNRLKMIDSDDIFCGVTEPTSEKCRNCSNIEAGMKHFSLTRSFLHSIKEYIYSIIAPSEYVSEMVGNVYPELKEKILVRPHLNLKGNRTYGCIGERIKLAFVGAQMKEKGFDDWRILVEAIKEKCPEDYELFYFGTGKTEIDGVKKIYVSTSEQGENAMIDSLRKCEIDCAFVWPNWPETYSYVYYELALCGAYIVTNRISGNIYSEVSQKSNGVTFDKIENAISWLLEPAEVRRQINSYRMNGVYRPEISAINDELTSFVPSTNGLIISEMKTTPHESVFKTCLYRIKYRKYHL